MSSLQSSLVCCVLKGTFLSSQPQRPLTTFNNTTERTLKHCRLDKNTWISAFAAICLPSQPSCVFSRPFHFLPSTIGWLIGSSRRSRKERGRRKWGRERDLGCTAKLLSTVPAFHVQNWPLSSSPVWPAHQPPPDFMELQMWDPVLELVQSLYIDRNYLFIYLFLIPISFTFSSNEVCLKIKIVEEWKECEWYWLAVVWVPGVKRLLVNCGPDLMQHTSDSEIDAEYDNQFLVSRHPSDSPKRLLHMSKCLCILFRCSFNKAAKQLSFDQLLFKLKIKLESTSFLLVFFSPSYLNFFFLISIRCPYTYTAAFSTYLYSTFFFFFSLVYCSVTAVVKSCSVCAQLAWLLCRCQWSFL